MTITSALLAARVFESDRRHSARRDIAYDTVMLDREGREIDVRIVNVSEAGLMAPTDAAMCERERVRLSLPPLGWVAGTVVWELGEQFGVQFRSPLTTAELDAVFGQLPSENAA